MPDVPPLANTLAQPPGAIGDSVVAGQFAQLWVKSLLLLARCCFLLTCFFLPVSTTLTDIFFVATACLIFLSGIVWRQAKRLLSQPVARVLLFAVAFVLLGIVYSIAPIGEALLYCKKYLWLLLTPFLFLLVTTERIRTQSLFSFMLAMLLTLSLSYLNYFGVVHIVLAKGPASIFKDHIIQSFLMSIMALICLLQLQQSQPRWRKGVFFILFLLAGFNILFLSEGRIGYLLLPVVVIYSWVLSFGWRKVLFPCVTVAFLFLIGLKFSPIMQQRLQVTEQSVMSYDFLSLKQGHTSLGIRRTMWYLGAKIVKQRPIMGYGTGSIHTVLTKIPESWVVENNWIRRSHTLESTFLNVGIQFGLLGLILLFAASVYLWRCARTINDPFYRSLMHGVMLALLIGFFFNAWLVSTTEKHFFALMLVICFCMRPDTTISNKHYRIPGSDDANLSQ